MCSSWMLCFNLVGVYDDELAEGEKKLLKLWRFCSAWFHIIDTKAKFWGLRVYDEQFWDLGVSVLRVWHKIEGLGV